MSKRRKRKLLNENRKLKQELEIVRADRKRMLELYEDTQKRLRLAGSEVETIDGPAGPIQVINAEAKAYGQYVLVTDQGVIDECKGKLIQSLAEGLAESNVVQFIIKGAGYSPFESFISVGAKLYVVPWEELRTGRKIQIKREALHDLL